MNDIIIIGGGISGLYLQYKLLKRRKYKKVLLVEKYNRLGGRIFTYKTNVNNTNYSMEAGAGRFSNNHKNLFALIRDMKLSNKIIEIGGKVDYYPRKLKWKKSKVSNFSPYDYIDLILKEIKIDKSLQQLTFGEFLNKNINKEINEFIRDTYPYKDVFKTNAYDAIRLYKRDLKDSTRFFILKGGLNQVVDNLKKEILRMGGIIKLNTECKEIVEVNKEFLISTNNKNYMCKKLILTAQRPDLQKIKYLKSINHLLNSVRNANLCRFYFIFDTSKKEAWFTNIKKSITDSRVSYFIPINSKTGLVMISYVDEHNAKFLRKMEKENKNKFINFILSECEKIFNIENIPKPIWTKSFYWENGVGDWKKNVDSDQIQKAIVKPYTGKHIYICGENWSKNYQCWIEGSLDTANNVLKKIN